MLTSVSQPIHYVFLRYMFKVTPEMPAVAVSFQIRYKLTVFSSILFRGGNTVWIIKEIVRYRKLINRGHASIHTFNSMEDIIRKCLKEGNKQTLPHL